MQHRRRKLVRVKHVIRLGTGVAFKEALQALGFSGRVNTAFIERVNLTIRRAARGQRPCKPHIWKPTYTGGSPIITSCGPTARCGWWWAKDKRSILHQGDFGTGNARRLWPLGERRTGGRLSNSSVASCLRTRLEQARKPEVCFFLASGGLMPRPRDLRLEPHRLVFQGEEAKMSPITVSQGLGEFSPIFESSTAGEKWYN